MKKIVKTVNKNRIAIISISLALLVFILYNMFSVSMVQALSKYGSRGDEVRQIQTKLKRWGYYSGNVDGIYGSGTLSAVKYFQRKNGLGGDVIAGKRKLEAMGLYTSSTRSSASSNSSDVNLLARLVYGEAR